MKTPHEHGRTLPKVATPGEENPVRTGSGDTLDREGAKALAARLQQYWHDQGYPAARFWTEPVDERFSKLGTHEIYRVACNLVKGLPPRYRHEPDDKK